MKRPSTMNPRAARGLAGPLRGRAPAFVVAVCAIAGCAGPVAVGKHAYEESRYLEAAEWLGAHEPDLAGLPVHEQAEYGVYRGLALLHVGDRSAAQRWLAFAYAIESGRPGTLGGPQRSALDQGWTALGLSDAAPDGGK